MSKEFSKKIKPKNLKPVYTVEFGFLVRERLIQCIKAELVRWWEDDEGIHVRVYSDTGYVYSSILSYLYGSGELRKL